MGVPYGSVSCGFCAAVSGAKWGNFSLIVILGQGQVKDWSDRIMSSLDYNNAEEDLRCRIDLTTLTIYT
jgi:hypothetical protein